MVYAVALLASLAVAVLGDIYDVTYTSRGLKTGVALEGFTFLIGSKPSTRALYLRDALVLGLCIAPTALSATVFHNLPIAYGALSAPVVYGIKHYLGARSWQKLGVK
jgi:hypothetical protein